MIKINKKHKKDIDALRKQILAEMAAQDKLFSKLCKKLGIDFESEDAYTLFDHIYNNTDWTIEYTDEKTK